MKSIVALSFSLVFASVIASGQELTKEAKIERILALQEANGNAPWELIKSAVSQSQTQVPGTTPEQQARGQETQLRMLDSIKMLSDKMRPQYVKLYSETFSAEEIDGILLSCCFINRPPGGQCSAKVRLSYQK